MNHPKTLLLVGCGHMGGSLLKGWINAFPALEATVIEPAGKPPIDGIAWVASLQELAADYQPEMVVFGLKPQIMAGILPDYQRFKEKACFVSMAAGRSLASLQAMLGADAALVRIMPNLPVSVQRGVTGFVCNAQVTEEDASKVAALAEAVGVAVALETEAQLDALTAVSGSGPAYLFHFAEALERAAQSLGFNEETARTLAIETTLGSAKLLDSDGITAAEWRQRVTSPGGTTAAALDVLMQPEGGFEALLAKALAQALARAKELSS